MVFEKNRVRAALLALPLAIGLSLGAATAAHAAETDDPRATAYDGNAKTCADAGLSGDRIVQVDGENDYGTDLITYQGGALNGDQYLDITAVDDGVEVTGIVVKGSNGYNVYVPGAKDLGETPPWEDLRSPLTDSGNVPQISHWYVCGSYTPPTSTTTTTDTTTTTETTTTTSETSATETTTASSTSEETTTETSGGTTSSVVASSTTDVVAPTSSSVPPAIDNTSDDGDLATTGFGGGWLIWAGVLFLLGGAGTIAGARALRRQ